MGLTFRLGQLPTSLFTDASNNVGIGAAASGSYKLQVTGTTNLTDALSGTSATFSGTATATAFIPSGATIPTNGMYLSAANTLNFATNSTNRLSIASNGASIFQNVLTIGSVGEDYVYITGGSGLGSLIQLRTASAGVINSRLSGNLDNYVVASTGNFGVGTTTPDSKLQVAGTCKIDSALTCVSEIILGGSGNYPTGGVGFRNDGTNLNIYYGANNCLFKDVSNVERMRISASGNLSAYQNITFGNTGTGSTPPNTHTFLSSGYFQSGYMMQVNHKGTGPSNTYMHDWFFSGASGSWSSGTGQQFLRCRDDQNRLIIYESGNIQNYNNSYGSLSDIKIKENIVDATPKLDKLMQVRIVNYNKIGDNTKQIGVIAQELEKIFPSLIEEFEDTKDIEIEKVDENGNIILDTNGNPTMESKLEFLGTKTKSVKYSVFVPMLIKAIQEQQAQIEELKALIAAK